MIVVLPNHTISKNGERFIVRGVQMFDYLLASFEVRDNYNFREIYLPEGKGAAYGISEPTYNGRNSYISADHVRSELTKVYAAGANLVRLGVEPAVRYASVSYVDPVDSNTYPSDIEMMDTIISEAEALGMVVQLQNSNFRAPVADNVSFLSWLADRYKGSWNVWINPCNEINGTNANVNNASVWQTEMLQYMAAIRGAGFKNIVCIDPPGWAYRIDLIDSILSTVSTFKDDENLVINIHTYPQLNQVDFVNTQLATATSQWFQYANKYCIVIGEVGIDNYSGRYDPTLDPGVPSVDSVAFGKMQTFLKDFLLWCRGQARLNGVIGHHWGAWISGLQIMDDNSMHKHDGSWSTWGTIFRDCYLSPPIQPTVSSSAAGISMVAYQAKNITSITLGAGEWDIDLRAYLTLDASTSLSWYQYGLSEVPDTMDFTPGRYYSHVQAPAVLGNVLIGGGGLRVRVRCPSQKTFYLVERAQFSAGGVMGSGNMCAVM